MKKRKEFKDKFILSFMKKRLRWIVVVLTFLGYIFGIYFGADFVKLLHINQNSIVNVLFLLIFGILFAYLGNKLSEKI